MSECGLTNLASCITEKFFGFLLEALNNAVQPLLDTIQKLLTEPVNINTFHPMWAVVVYIISLFYGLFFLFAGFNLMISGHDVARREKAKHWLRNIVLMIIFVQASFLVYDLVIELASLMTAGIIDIIDPSFFVMTSGSMLNFGLQLILMPIYLFILVGTVILLGLRYLMVAVGVVLFPFGLFFYFIPPLQSYGKLILNLLLVTIFVTFFDAIILFGASALVNISVFSSFKIILVMVAFLNVNLVMTFLMLFVALKSAFSMLNSGFGRNVKSAAKYLV